MSKQFSKKNIRGLLFHTDVKSELEPKPIFVGEV